MQKSILLLLISACLSLTDCVSSQNNVNSDIGSSAPTPIITEITDNTSAARQIGDNFANYWNALDDRVFLGTTVEVFAADLIRDYDKTVFLVYPEYKTCRAMIYGVNGGDAELIGDISCGFKFALSDANDGMIRASKTYYMSHSSETLDTYYKISSVGIEETQCIGVSFFGETDITGYTQYINGESAEITEKEYISLKETADSDFTNAILIDLDADNDLHMDGGCGISDKEILTEYILGKIN